MESASSPARRTHVRSSASWSACECGSSSAVMASPVRPSPTRFWAVSRNSPVGRPLGSFTMVPPDGSGVLPVIPSSSIAFAFTIEEWPLACVRRTGFRGDTADSASCTGTPSTLPSGRPFHFSWCHPRPRIQAPGLAVAAASRTIATMSSHDLAFVRSRIVLDCPNPRKCPCPSMKPGMTRRPCRSIVFVSAPVQDRISSSVPTAAMR